MPIWQELGFYSKDEVGGFKTGEYDSLIYVFTVHLICLIENRLMQGVGWE